MIQYKAVTYFLSTARGVLSNTKSRGKECVSCVGDKNISDKERSAILQTCKFDVGSAKAAFTLTLILAVTHDHRKHSTRTFFIP